MNFLVILCALAVSVSAGVVHVPVAYEHPVYVKPIVGQSQYRAQNTMGQYSYGFASTDGISKSEARNVDGSVSGSYAYTAPDGQKVQMTYTAGEDGFKPTGEAIPKPVEPTSDVRAATEQHETAKAAQVKAIEEAAEKKTVLVSAVPTTYTYAHPYYQFYPNFYPYHTAYKFHPVAYKTIVTELKPTPHQSHSYAFTS